MEVLAPLCFLPAGEEEYMIVHDIYGLDSTAFRHCVDFDVFI